MSRKIVFTQPASSGVHETLIGGGYEVVIAPACGARIVSLRRDGRDILRGADKEALDKGSVYGFGGFPLMPYSGPIFSGGFTHRGLFHPLSRNVREEPTATHGEGWIRPWTIIARNPSSIRLALDHRPEPGSFPFAWRGDLIFTVDDAGLRIDMTLTSRDYRPMPAGMGFHPYFPKPAGTKLRFEAVAIWPPDAPEAVDLSCIAIPPGLDFSCPRDVSELVLDRCYEGWSGDAEIIAPDGGVTRVSCLGALSRLQVYSAWDEPYVCVEPVSNANDGFNRRERGLPIHGVVELAPGATLSGGLTIGTV